MTRLRSLEEDLEKLRLSGLQKTQGDSSSVPRPVKVRDSTQRLGGPGERSWGPRGGVTWREFSTT